MDFGGQRAGEILFEQKGVSRDSKPCIPTWEEITRTAQNCFVKYDKTVGRKTNRKIFIRTGANTNAAIDTEKSPTLTAYHDGVPILFESHSQDARYKSLGVVDYK